MTGRELASKRLVSFSKGCWEEAQHRDKETPIRNWNDEVTIGNGERKNKTNGTQSETKIKGTSNNIEITRNNIEANEVISCIEDGTIEEDKRHQIFYHQPNEQRSEIRGQRSEIRGQRSEIRDQRSPQPVGWGRIFGGWICQSSPLCICLLAYWHSQQLHGNVVKASILRISRLNVWSLLKCIRPDVYVIRRVIL